uniref:RSN1_7TM domain-containing protein n=1 Tax=Macrostomum lignano TaxID=282301 RepID=A0A1I8JPH5_9PLAT
SGHRLSGRTDSAAGLMDTMSRRLTLLLHHLSFYAPLGCLLTWFVPVRRGITAAFLHSASTRLARLNREAGRISNRGFAGAGCPNVNRFLGVISLQYLCPLAVTLFLALMYKTLSGCSWDSGRLSGHLPLYNLARANSTSQSNTSTRVDELRSLASPQTAGGLLSYGLFWSLFSTFVTSMHPKTTLPACALHGMDAQPANCLLSCPLCARRC